jgi:hypothetical protein
MIWPSPDELRAHTNRQRELAAEPLAVALERDLTTMLIVATLAIGIVACCGPTAPLDPLARCAVVQLGRDSSATTHAVTTWKDYRCADGVTWRRFSDGTVYRIGQ